jgi:SLT domain-containing protein
MDFTVATPPTKEEGRAVTDYLKQMGASLAIDEYNNPTSGATGGHYHAQIPAFANGGLVDDATLSMIGEAGPEAVIPLKDGNVPVSFNGKMGLGDEAMGLFKIMAEQTSTMAAMMEQMVSAQKNSVDVQNKMLRAQS